MSKHITTFKGWADTFRVDLEALKAVVESSSAAVDARKLCAGSLLYLVMRLDLVPDHEQGIGVLDDVMVMRTCAALASSHDLGTLPAAAEVALGRMANEADQVATFLGASVADKFKAYCSKLADTTVRGKSAATVIADAAVRAALYQDIDDEAKKSVPVIITDAADAELRLRSYFEHKLGKGAS